MVIELEENEVVLLRVHDTDQFRFVDILKIFGRSDQESSFVKEDYVIIFFKVHNMEKILLSIYRSLNDGNKKKLLDSVKALESENNLKS